MSGLRSSLLVVGCIAAVTVGGATSANLLQAGAQSMKPLVVSDLNTPALRPFQFELCRENNADSCAGRDFELTVPTVTADGEAVTRYVIEYVSAQCAVFPSTGFVGALSLRTTASGATVFHDFVPFRLDLSDKYAAAQDARIYADPGSEIRLVTGVTAQGNWCIMSVSGHLVVE